MPCWCNPKTPCGSENYRMRILDTISVMERYCSPLGKVLDPCEWQRCTITAFSSIEVQCNECGIVATPSINNLMKQKSILCACSTRWPYASDETRTMLLERLELRDLVPFGEFKTAIESEVEWKRVRPVSETRMSVICQRCDIAVSSTRICTFLNRGAINCLCRNKTQLFAFKLIDDLLIGTKLVARNEVPGPGRTRFDIGVFEEQTLLYVCEVDGPQHFSNSFCSDTKVYDRARENDRKKDKNAKALGIALIRVSQPHLWGGNGKQLQQSAIEFVRRSIDKLKQGSLSPGVYFQPKVREYREILQEHACGRIGFD